VKRVVAVDGPSGSGKSTVSRGVADALALSVLDTGAMYRAVTLAALDPAVTDAVSIVSAHPRVREVLVGRQREWVERHGGGVVEGRDIGTVVFPDAPVKVFLTASDDERARRRQRDEWAADRDVDVESVRKALGRRDQLDASRATSPLRRADDALVIDTTGRDADDVVAEIVARYEALS
jgi:cytidylate kinase